MPTYRMLLEYNGTEYSGWQKQSDQYTIQQSVEEALEILLRKTTPVVASGRTDAGVHAKGQVTHFHTSDDVDTLRLRRSLNGLLPESIAVRAVEPAQDEFHARYDARRRRYHYYVSTEPVALDLLYRVPVHPEPDFVHMNQASVDLLGKQDFSSFCRTQSETQNRVCSVYHANWVNEERPGDWYFEIIADRFLHGMVRSIVGTLLQIGHQKRPVDDIRRILAEQDRRAAGCTAPPNGLILEHVDYPGLSWNIWSEKAKPGASSNR